MALTKAAAAPPMPSQINAQSFNGHDIKNRVLLLSWRVTPQIETGPPRRRKKNSGGQITSEPPTKPTRCHPVSTFMSAPLLSWSTEYGARAALARRGAQFFGAW